MRTLYRSIVCALVLVNTLHAQDTAQVTFRVVDDFSSAVSNSTVRLFSFRRWLPGSEAGRREYDHKDGVTDTNGIAVIAIDTKHNSLTYHMVPSTHQRQTANSWLRLGDGREYYDDFGERLLLTNVLSGKWQPWNPTIEVVVKPVFNPIAMYARRPDPGENYICKTPELGRAFGFDLMESDWVNPHGKGRVVDFLIRIDSKPSVMPADYYERYPTAVRETDTTLTLSFANPDDGILSVFADPLRGSALRLPRFAPETGYQTNYTSRFYIKDARLINEGDRRDQNYFFRVRSKRDENGSLVSALYGKIHGPIKFAADGQVGFEYYLNPTPMDRNMEFDHQKNLFQGKR